MVQSHTSEKNKFSEEFKRKSRVVEPGLYIIACEGTKDEPAYIKAFVRKHRVRAKVFIAEREEGDFATNPWHLYKLLQNSIKSIKTKHKDSLFGWIMVDRDKDRIPELKEIKKECDKEGIRIAYSSPCVELWFLLHYKDLSLLDPKTKQKLLIPKPLKRHLKRHCIDISKGFNGLFPLTQRAIDRAKGIDNPNVDFPERFCTRVYLLIQELLTFQ